jgi:hypothetical protein
MDVTTLSNLPDLLARVALVMGGLGITLTVLATLVTSRARHRR